MGIDLVTMTVARAAGLRFDGPAVDSAAPQPPGAGAAAIRFLIADRPGRLRGIGGVDVARRRPGVADVGLIREPGYEVRLQHSFQDRLAYVVAADTDVPVGAGPTVV